MACLNPGDTPVIPAASHTTAMCLAAAVIVAAAVGAQENRIRTLQHALLNTWEKHRAAIEAVDSSLCFAELQHAMSIVSCFVGDPLHAT